MKTSPRLHARAIDSFLRLLRKLPAPRNEYLVERGLRTPTRDGVVLVGDHYAPAGSRQGSGTILIRTPYGRGLPVAQLWGSTFAARGYHVLLQSCRGTAGSTGTFEPMVREGEDAQDTVVWLREQPWFNGDLATMGMSYLAYTQWALLAVPPPELRASVMVAGPHDFSRAIWENDAFALETFLGWSVTNSVPFEQRPSLVRQLTGDRAAGEPAQGRLRGPARRVHPCQQHLHHPLPDGLADELATQRAERLDGHATDYSPIDTAAWSPSGATKAATK